MTTTTTTTRPLDNYDVVSSTASALRCCSTCFVWLACFDDGRDDKHFWPTIIGSKRKQQLNHLQLKRLATSKAVWWCSYFSARGPPRTSTRRRRRRSNKNQQTSQRTISIARQKCGKKSGREETKTHQLAVTSTAVLDSD